MLSHGYRLATAVRKTSSVAHGKALIYTVDALKEKASGYLAIYDTAQASEKSFQAQKLALMTYVKRLEESTDVKIVPRNLENPWSYRIFNKMCRLIAKKSDSDRAKDIVAGWETGYKFHVRGWTQNDLSVEDVEFSIPFVFRFIEIIDKELQINREMAKYLKENLFTINIDQIAEELYEDARKGKVTHL